MNTIAAPNHQPPKPSPGERDVTVYPEWSDDEPVVCRYEVHAGEVNLIAAYIRGWDCYRVLSREQFDEAETLVRENT